LGLANGYHCKADVACHYSLCIVMYCGISGGFCAKIPLGMLLTYMLLEIYMLLVAANVPEYYL